MHKNIVDTIKNKFKNVIPEVWNDGRIGYPINVIALHRMLWVLRFYGTPIPSEHIQGYIKFLYLIYSAFSMIIIFTFYVSCEIMDAYYVTISADLEDIIHNYGLTFNFITGLFKICNLLWNWGTINGMIKTICFCTHKYGNTKYHTKKLEKLERLVTAAYYIFISCSWITLAAGYHMIITDPKTLGTKLPFRAYIPEFLPTSLKYPIHIISTLWISQIVITHDCFIMALMNQIVEQLMILEYNLRNLIANNETTDKAMVIDKLKSYIKHHQMILKMNSDLESIFSRIFLIQFLTSLLMFGLCGFLVTYKQNFSTSQLAICMYCACVLTELYIYCYFANQILLQSKAITTSAYSCSWYEFGNKFSVLLLILMAKSQINLTLSAGGFFVMSLDTFTFVLTRSYSYIAILRRFYYGK